MCIALLYTARAHLLTSRDILVLIFLPSQPEKDLTRHKEKNMATVSRQSAFWAVVALGLNTFVQPGGKVLGFPAEYSRALRLSLILCIVDTLGVLYSVAFFCYKTRSFKKGLALAARYRCLTEDAPAEPRLERTWWFRLLVFVPGALPQAVKILGMGGIPLTKVWGMAYLVSFLVLEGLDLLQPRQPRDYHAFEPDAAVLDIYMWLLGFLAVCIQCQCFVVELFLLPSRLDIKCVLEPGRYLPELGGAGRMVVIIESGSVLVMFVPFVLVKVLYPLFNRTYRALPGDFVVMIQIGLSIPGVITYLVGLDNLFRRLSSCPPYLRFLVLMELIVLFLGSFFLVWIWYEAALQIRWSRELFGLKRREGFLPLLFAAWTIASIICYYMFIYDPSDTYKPPWTENLG